MFSALYRFPSRRSACILVAVFLLTLLPVLPPPAAAAAVFKDLKPGSSDAIYGTFLQGRGVIGGYSDGTFRAQAPVTRAEMAVMLVKACALPLERPQRPTFTDVKSNHWAYASIETAVKAGLIKGYPDGLFKPESRVTRAESAAMLLGLTRSSSPALTMPAAIQDVNSRHWARSLIATSLSAGVLTPKSANRFAPETAAQRGEIAFGLTRMLTTAPDRMEVPLSILLQRNCGEVKLSGPSPNPIQIDKEMACSPGQTIETGKDGEARLSFPDGSNLLMKRNTKIEIIKARGQSVIRQDGSPGAVIDYLEIKLVQGKVFGALAATYFIHPEVTAPAAVKGQSVPGSASLFAGEPQEQPKTVWWKEASAKRVRVQMDMPWGVAGVRGTMWANAVSPSGQSTSVVDGSVEVTANGVSVEVPEGSSTVVAGQGQAPAPPARMPAAERQEWQAQQQWVQETLQAIKENAPVIQEPPGQPDQPQTPTAPAVDQIVSQVLESYQDSTTQGTSGGSGGGSDSEPAPAPAASDASAATVTPSTAAPSAAVPFTLSMTGVKDTAGSSITGSVNVRVLSNNSMEGATGEVFNSAVSFSAGTASASITLSQTGAQVLSVSINGVTGSKTVSVTVNLPPAVSAVQVACGYSHTLALASNGTVWAWGKNSNGQLGTLAPADQSVPVLIPGLTNVVAVAAGQYHSVALKRDGTVWAWGQNLCGQLGDGSQTDRTSPVQVTGLTGVAKIAAGYTHTLAVKADGTVWAWGANGSGQLGDGTATLQKTAVQVIGPGGVGYLTNITEIAGGDIHTVARRNNGAVYIWGENTDGRLGLGTFSDQTTPALLTGIPAVIKVAAGYGHTLFLHAGGAVSAVGMNNCGQIGDGTMILKTSVTPIAALSGIAGIAAGYEHSMAYSSSGNLFAWGKDDRGQLGDGAIVDKPNPVPAIGFSGITGVSGGTQHTVAITSTGLVSATGNNVFGELGNGSATESHQGVAANGFSQLSAGLTGLTVTNATLSPTFSQTQLAYTGYVDHAVTGVMVTPTAGAGTITVNGTTAASASAFGPVPLNPGENTILVSVTEPGKGSKVYTLKITRSSTVLVSLGDCSTEDAVGNEDSTAVSVSMDGNVVAFYSAAGNLTATPPGTLNSENIYVRNRSLGSTVRLTNTTSYAPAVSLDGRWVAFISGDETLVPGDNNGNWDAFVYDLQTSTVARVSESTSGVQANDDSGYSTEYQPSVSAGGRYVAFVSDATNLLDGGGDTNGFPDVFVRDRDVDCDSIFDEVGEVKTIRVSVDTSGAQGNGWSFNPVISGNGRFVAFASNASNLVAFDTNSVCDVFVHDRDADNDGIFDEPGAISTVCMSQNLLLFPAGGGYSGTNIGGESGNIAMSSNGRYVAFQSISSDFGVADGNGCTDIYIRDRDVSGDGVFDQIMDVATERVSLAYNGAESNGGSTQPAISNDGRYVVFLSTATNLIETGTNSTDHIFVRDRVLNTTKLAAIMNTGAAAYSHWPAISGDGRYIFFESANVCDSTDTNGPYCDIYMYDTTP
ncbi:MAG: S-layer homology domain-containing protein [Solirubrobacterales bacterium]